MVTRRPIELTLVNNLDSDIEYGVFTDLDKDKKYTNFENIQTVLNSLNNEIDENDIISDVPVKLKIFSPNVPDLTLIDLPGYIQTHKLSQSKCLKPKIKKVCEKYIKNNNIILTVCAGDVDLANSEALNIAREFDQRGERTLGIITKMDLIDPEYAINLLENKDYRLKLGYIGLVCDKHIRDEYFSRNRIFEKSAKQVGIVNLKEKLVSLLEEKIKRELTPLLNKIEDELEDNKYHYKVEYNDRNFSAEAYIADTMDTLKHKFRFFENVLNIKNTSFHLTNFMENKMLNICAECLWTVSEDKKSLQFMLTKLTKSGIGKYTTNYIVENLLTNMKKILEQQPFTYHKRAHEIISNFTEEIIKQKYKQTVEQVENSIKPYKRISDVDDEIWKRSRARSVDLLEKELKMCTQSLSNIKKKFGTYQLRQAIRIMRDSPNDTDMKENQFFEEINNSYDSRNISLANKALLLESRMNVLRYRLSLIRSSKCKSSKNKEQCQEIYLAMISDKIAKSSSTFIQIELLDEFYYSFPRELDNHIVYRFNSKMIEDFAKENPRIQEQLKLKEKITKLKKALEKLKYIVYEHEI